MCINVRKRLVCACGNAIRQLAPAERTRCAECFIRFHETFLLRRYAFVKPVHNIKTLMKKVIKIYASQRDLVPTKSSHRRDIGAKSSVSMESPRSYLYSLYDYARVWYACTKTTCNVLSLITKYIQKRYFLPYNISGIVHTTAQSNNSLFSCTRLATNTKGVLDC